MVPKAANVLIWVHTSQAPSAHQSSAASPSFIHPTKPSKTKWPLKGFMVHIPCWVFRNMIWYMALSVWFMWFSRKALHALSLKRTPWSLGLYTYSLVASNVHSLHVHSLKLWVLQAAEVPDTSNMTSKCCWQSIRPISK